MPPEARRIVLFGSRRPLDQFAGVPRALQQLGTEVFYERLWDREMRFGHHANPEVIDGAHALAFADLSYNAHLAPTRLARERHIPTLLLADGVVEYANTYRNPWLGPAHLQRTPHDRVLAMGPLQARLLEQLGNHVITTGLPRLDGFEHRIAETRQHVEPNQWLLVATALTPALDDDALERVRHMLRSLRDEADHRNLRTRWRIAPQLADAIGVPVDTAPLTESLAGARATLTTASTLAVESMIAGVPTAVAQPHPWPLWVPAAWVWQHAPHKAPLDGLPIEYVPSCSTLLDTLLASPDLANQQTILAKLHTPNAAANVARALHGVTFTNNTNPIPSMTHLHVAPSACDTLHIAICDHEQPRPRIIDRALSAMATNTRDHLLCVGLSPLNFQHTNTPTIDHPRTHEIVLDPTAARHERAQSLLDAALSLHPDRVVVDDDRALPLAAQLVSRGVRCDDPRLAPPNDHGVRTIEHWPYGPCSPASERDADAWLERELILAGYHRIAYDQPASECDAVLVRAAAPRPHPATVERWRANGLGVVISPNMHVETGVYAAERAIARLQHPGCTRLCVAGTAERSPILAAPIRHGAPIVGWLDDEALEPSTHMGLPAHAFDVGLATLKPDGLLVLHESMLERCCATGLPTELIDLHEALADQPDHRVGEPIHREPLAHPGVDRR